jgi:hypothetical protein
MHLLVAHDSQRLIFGGYFLIPFFLVLAVLLLEMALISRRQRALWCALAAPLGLVILAGVGHRHDSIYQEFLHLFTARFGGDPLYLTLLALVGFYAYAGLRRVPHAAEMLTAVLIALVVIGPHTLLHRELVTPQLWPLLCAALLQLGLGIRRGHSGRCLLGAVGLVAVAALGLTEVTTAALLWIIVFHLSLAAALLLGAAFEDRLAQILRLLVALLVFLACLVVMAGWPWPAELSAWGRIVYPLILGLLLLGYGLLLSHRTTWSVAALVLLGTLALASWWGYFALRQVVPGLDFLTLSLALFALALLVSLGKSGLLSRWLQTGPEQVSRSVS